VRSWLVKFKQKAIDEVCNLNQFVGVDASDPLVLLWQRQVLATEIERLRALPLIPFRPTQLAVGVFLYVVPALVSVVQVLATLF
jgi:hypothetical protein